MPATQVLALLRRVVATIMAAHGLYRAITPGAVTGFGRWLTQQGFVAGDLVAAGITGAELVGAAALWFGWQRRIVAVLFVVELSVGLVLVHFPAGWFVVGGGRNGMEFSVVLIAVLLGVAAETQDPAARS